MRFLLALLLSLTLARGEDATRQRVVLVGDSTVAEQSGWGPAFAKLLRADVECLNFARGGRSSKSYRAEGHWDAAMKTKPTWVLIQFGHNDQPGKGPERETDPATTFPENIARYADEARAAGARPVLITSMVRRTFRGDKLISTLTPYVDAVKKVAADKNLPLIDLDARSRELCEKLGPTGSDAFNPPGKDGRTDRTHLNAKGSVAMANLVAAEIRANVPELAKLLSGEDAK